MPKKRKSSLSYRKHDNRSGRWRTLKMLKQIGAERPEFHSQNLNKMAENADNGLDVPIKTEPDDPLLEIETPIIPKEFTLANGIHEDSDCEDVSYFTQLEVDNTRKCLENTRLIIKDFETQLDWHLQQYMTLRNVYNPKKNSKNGKEDPKRQDLLSISQLSAIIANHPEGNKKFIKRKGPVSNGAGRKRRRNRQESDTEEDSEFSEEEESEEYDEEEFDEGRDSEDEDDPGVAKKPVKKRGGRKKNDGPQVKDEIEAEEHTLVEPKVERASEDREVNASASPKKGRSPRKTKAEAKTPAKRTPRGKKAKMDTVDLTSLKTCKVVLNRINDDTNDSIVEIKSEDIDRDELVELLKKKGITSYDDYSIDPEKPIFILKNDNVDTFDFTECKTSNVVITFEHLESLPEFIFSKDVANCILNGSITLVHSDVFDQHLADDKN